MHSAERPIHGPGPHGDAGHHGKHSQAERKLSSKSKGSISTAAARREEQQRREEQYQKWEEFKAIQREDKHAYLEEKVLLQRELIQAQDALAVQRRLETDRKLEELRRSEVQKKKETEEALTKICKDELEREKEEALTKKAQERAAERERQKEEKQKAAGEEEPALIERNNILSTIPSRAETGLSEGSAFEPHDATGVLMEEGEDTIQEEVTFDELPSHKQKLYGLFGQEEAEYFLHPRIEPERRKVIRVPQAVKQLGGRAGADTLWDTLRDRSKVKLQYADARIPLELKDAYGAFVRECLTKNKTVAKRSFYSETEVPDSEKLQDNSYRERVKEIQRRMELMFRAAVANEDKTGVLLYNNPMPDFNNLEGHEGPLRYLPSWIQVDDGDDDTQSEEKELSYKKWLPSASEMEQMEPFLLGDNVTSYDIDMVQGDSGRHDGLEGEEDEDEDDNHFKVLEDDPQLGSRTVSSQSLLDLALGDEEDIDIYPPHPQHSHQGDGDGHYQAQGGSPGEPVDGLMGTKAPKKTKLVFLTEKDATCEGHFMENIAAQDTSRDLVTGANVMEAGSNEKITPREDPLSSRRGKPKLRSQTAPDAIGKTASTSGSSRGTGPVTPRDGRASERRSRGPGSSKGSSWEPLTMTALTDHKPAIQLLGGTDFAHGQEFMWKPILSTAPKGS
ncbi:uncharacterized protein [Diadema antillarum]|uniref:uncharacterized protein n=1 Tax=Diadema antillarum TaxID=105358 RepID=UPI003A859F52